MRLRPRGPACALALLLLAACGSTTGEGSSSSSSSATSSAAAAALTVTSSGFTDGKPLPDEFTCSGAGQMPPLAWTGDVGDAEAVAVVVDDPDAPGGTYYHLVVLDLAPTTRTLSDPLPSDATVALNSDGSPGWTAPCPPSGTHHYRFRVFALTAPTGLDAQTEPKAAVAAIEKSLVAEGRLVGLVSA